MPQRTFEIDGVVTGIQIQVSSPIPDPSKTFPRLVLEGIFKDTVTGEQLRRFSEDVTDQLTVTQKNQVIAIVTRAQAWVDNKVTQ